MPDSLDSVRALYQEPRPDGMPPTPESLSATARAEVAAFAPVKAALDARPRSGPDADTLAAVLRAARAASTTASDSATTTAAKPRASDRAPVRAARRSRSRIALPVLALFACVAIGVALVAQQAEELPNLDPAESAAPMAAAVPSAEVAPGAEGDAALLTEAPTEAQARDGRPVAQPSPQARQVAPTTELVGPTVDDVPVQSDLAAADVEATDWIMQAVPNRSFLVRVFEFDRTFFDNKRTSITEMGIEELVNYLKTKFEEGEISLVNQMREFRLPSLSFSHVNLEFYLNFGNKFNPKPTDEQVVKNLTEIEKFVPDLGALFLGFYSEARASGIPVKMAQYTPKLGQIYVDYKDHIDSCYTSASAQIPTMIQNEVVVNLFSEKFTEMALKSNFIFTNFRQDDRDEMQNKRLENIFSSLPWLATSTSEIPGFNGLNEGFNYLASSEPVALNEFLFHMSFHAVNKLVFEPMTQFLDVQVFKVIYNELVSGQNSIQKNFPLPTEKYFDTNSMGRLKELVKTQFDSDFANKGPEELVDESKLNALRVLGQVFHMYLVEIDRMVREETEGQVNLLL